MKNWLKRDLLSSEAGAGVTDYALLVVLIVAVVTGPVLWNGRLDHLVLGYAGCQIQSGETPTAYFTEDYHQGGGTCGTLPYEDRPIWGEGPGAQFGRPPRQGASHDSNGPRAEPPRGVPRNG